MTAAAKAVTVNVPSERVVTEYGKVSKVSKRGGRVHLTVRHAEQITSCRKTNRIRHIWPDGRVEYESDCTTTKKPRYLYTVTAEFEAKRLPPGLKRGDEIVFVGRAAGKKGKVKHFEGIHLMNQYRRGKSLGDWNLYSKPR